MGASPPLLVLRTVLTQKHDQIKAVKFPEKDPSFAPRVLWLLAQKAKAQH